MGDLDRAHGLEPGVGLDVCVLVEGGVGVPRGKAGIQGSVLLLHHHVGMPLYRRKGVVLDIGVGIGGIGGDRGTDGKPAVQGDSAAQFQGLAHLEGGDIGGGEIENRRLVEFAEEQEVLAQGALEGLPGEPGAHGLVFIAVQPDPAAGSGGMDDVRIGFAAQQVLAQVDRIGIVLVPEETELDLEAIRKVVLGRGLGNARAEGDMLGLLVQGFRDRLPEQTAHPDIHVQIMVQSAGIGEGDAVPVEKGVLQRAGGPCAVLEGAFHDLARIDEGGHGYISLGDFGRGLFGESGAHGHGHEGPVYHYLCRLHSGFLRVQCFLPRCHQKAPLQMEQVIPVVSCDGLGGDRGHGVDIVQADMIVRDLRLQLHTRNQGPDGVYAPFQIVSVDGPGGHDGLVIVAVVEIRDRKVAAVEGAGGTPAQAQIAFLVGVAEILRLHGQKVEDAEGGQMGSHHDGHAVEHVLVKDGLILDPEDGQLPV